jgi:hypothetical protein
MLPPACSSVSGARLYLTSIYCAGEVQLRTPNTELPFLFNLSSEALPSKAQSCGHCDAPVGDACNITRLPHTCCGVCQFDSRFCSRLYKGEGRSEAAAQQLLAAGFPLHVSDSHGRWLVQARVGQTPARRWSILSSRIRDWPPCACFVLTACTSLVCCRTSLPASCFSAFVAGRCGLWVTARRGASLQAVRPPVVPVRRVEWD